MLLSARTAAFTDHLSSWSHSLEVDCGHLKTALDRAPHEGYGRELLRHMEKEVAGLEQSLGQIHAATFSAGSLSSMLASALQYQAESEAQLARVRVEGRRGAEAALRGGAAQRRRALSTNTDPPRRWSAAASMKSKKRRWRMVRCPLAGPSPIRASTSSTDICSPCP